MRPERLAAAGLLGVPLLVDPVGWNRYTTLRGTAIAVLVVVGLAGLRRPRLDRRVALAGCVYLAVAAAATAVSIAPGVALWGTSDRRYGFVTIVVLAAVFVVGSIVGRAGAVGVLRAAPVWTVITLTSVLYELLRARGHAPAPSLVGNPSQLGGYLVLLLAADIALVHAATDDRTRIAGFVAALAAGGALLATGSQPAWIAGLVTAVALVRPAVRLKVAAAALVVGVVLLFAPFSPVGAAHTVDATKGRLEGWRVALSAIRDRPALGSGPDTGRFVLPAHLTERFARDYGVDPVQDRAHQVVLDEAVTTGVLGAVALVIFVVAVGAAIVSARDPVARAIGVGLAGYLVFLIAWFPTPATAAVALTLAGIASARGAGTRAVTPGALVLGAAALVAVVFGVRAVRADHAVAQRAEARDAAGFVDAAGAVTGGASERIAASDIALRSGDIALLRAAVALTNDTRDSTVTEVQGELHFALARRTRDPAELDAAERAFRRAIAIAPQQADAWLGLGETLSQTARKDEARAALQRAGELLPKSPAPRVDLAFLALAEGDADSARAAFTAACSVAPHDAQVLDLGRQLAQRGGQPVACGR